MLSVEEVGKVDQRRRPVGRGRNDRHIRLRIDDRRLRSGLSTGQIEAEMRSRTYPTTSLGGPADSTMHPSLPLMVLIGILGCSLPADPARAAPPADLAKAPTEVSLAGSTVTLQPTVWRDFQPGGDRTDTRLLGVLRIVSLDASPLPEGIVVKTVWFVRDTDAWRTEPKREYAGPPASQIEFVARGGPRWPVGATLDILLDLRAPSGAAVFLAARGTPIIRTD